MAWLCIASLVLVSVIDAHADDRAKQRAEAHIFTQIEKYEAWQEEIERELEALWDRAERLRQMGQRTQHSGKLAPFQESFSAQSGKVRRSRDKGYRILSRIRRACQQIKERWPPEPPECQEEFPVLLRFHNRLSTRQSDAEGLRIASAFPPTDHPQQRLTPR